MKTNLRVNRIKNGFSEIDVCGNSVSVNDISLADFMRCSENRKELEDIMDNARTRSILRHFWKILRAILWIIFFVIWTVCLVAGGELTMISLLVGVLMAFISIL